MTEQISIVDKLRRYADGAEIIIGDRFVIQARDNTINLGRVAMVLSPNTIEAHWCSMPNGGILVEIDESRMAVLYEFDERVKLISRGNNQDVEWARGIMRRMRCEMRDKNARIYRYDKYFTGEEIQLGDVVMHYGEYGIIEFFIAPNTQVAADYNAPYGGVMLLTFTGGRALFYTTEDDEGLKFVRRFDVDVAKEFEKHGKLCTLTYEDGSPVSVDDEIECIDPDGGIRLARVIAVCHPFTKLAWDEKFPTGGFKVRFDNGEIALFGQMSPTMRLLRRNGQPQ